MALAETRYQFRTSLSDTERRVDASQTLVVLLHPSERIERLFLRLIGWTLFYSPELQFGPGLSLPDEPALFSVDLTGRRTAWIGVNPASAEKMNHAARHHRGAQVAAVFGGEGAFERFLEGSRTLKGVETVEFVVVEQALLDALAEGLEERRYDLSVTLVENHLYFDFGGQAFSGTFRRFTGLPR